MSARREWSISTFEPWGWGEVSNQAAGVTLHASMLTAQEVSECFRACFAAVRIVVAVVHCGHSGTEVGGFSWNLTRRSKVCQTNVNRAKDDDDGAFTGLFGLR